MAKERGRPRGLPEELIYLRLAVTPEEHRQIQVAAGLAGESMAQFARRSVVEVAQQTLRTVGLDPGRLPAPASGSKENESQGGGVIAQGEEQAGAKKERRGKRKKGEDEV